MTIQTNLFDAGDGLVLERSANWLHTTLFGDLALGLCVLAVALFGCALLFGRISIARSWMTVAGCFVLAGAPGFAASLVQNREVSEVETIAHDATGNLTTRRSLLPSEHSPYSTASVQSQ